MSKKNITNEDVVNEAREQEVIEAEAKDVAQAVENPSTETEADNPEETKPKRRLRDSKVAKVAIGVGTFAIAGIAIGWKALCAYGDRAYERGRRQARAEYAKDEIRRLCNNEETSENECETQEEIEYPEDE